MAEWAASAACHSHDHPEAWATASMAAVVLARLVEDSGTGGAVRRVLERPFPLPGTHPASQFVDLVTPGSSEVTLAGVRQPCPFPIAHSALAVALAVANPSRAEPDRGGGRGGRSRR